MKLRTATVQQIQSLDKDAIEKIGIPSFVLMENAGIAVALEARRQLAKRKNPLVSVVCGLGNNGGDGFVAARHLLESGIRTLVFLAGQGGQLKNDARLNYQILKRLKYPVIEAGVRSTPPLAGLAKADLIVDALFGVGLNREVGEPFRSWIEAINASGARVLAVDIPSGLDGTTGQVYGVCVQADSTVTFTRAKQGFFQGRGPEQAGRVKVVDIGIPASIINKVLG